MVSLVGETVDRCVNYVLTLLIVFLVVLWEYALWRVRATFPISQIDDTGVKMTSSDVAHAWM